MGHIIFMPWRSSLQHLSSFFFLLANSQPGSEADSTESEEDVDYLPDPSLDKKIQVGSDYQVVVPEGFAPYSDAPPYENEDRLLWDPTVVDENKRKYWPKFRNMSVIFVR
jgi:hypothetical protein